MCYIKALGKIILCSCNYTWNFYLEHLLNQDYLLLPTSFGFPHFYDSPGESALSLFCG